MKTVYKTDFHREHIMKKINLVLPLLALGSAAQASDIRGGLGNFDALNHTGDTVYGIERIWYRN